jgi:Cu2+-exporting ATPase
VFRLGRPDWALPPVTKAGSPEPTANVVLSRDGECLARFALEDRLRDAAAATIAALRRAGLPVEILSGDRDATVGAIARALDVPYTAGVSPADKIARIAAIAASGLKPLMVGDGLNDAPALVAAHASMAPASAADIGRNAADLVFLQESLLAVPRAIGIARSAGRLVRQNLGLAVAYNLIAVPIAILGYVTPLVAAIAMSGSSIVVVANALRLRGSPQNRATNGSDKSVVSQPAAGRA